MFREVIDFIYNNKILSYISYMKLTRIILLYYITSHFLNIKYINSHFLKIRNKKEYSIIDSWQIKQPHQKV